MTTSSLLLKVQNHRDELSRIVDALQEFGLEQDWPQDLSFRVHLVVEEVILNIMDYGFDSGTHTIDLNIFSGPDALTLEFIDGGKPFDPLTQGPHPDTQAPIDNRPVGGLGIYLSLTMMDHASYRRDNNKNHLTLIAKREE